MNRPTRRPIPGPHLRRGEAWGGGLRRVTLECVAEAAAVMAAPGIAEAERVHRVRVTLKRARAVLRLCAAAGCRWARPARLRLSRLARELSRTRDATVIGASRRMLGLDAGAVSTVPPVGTASWLKALAIEKRKLIRQAWPEFTLREIRQALARMVNELACAEAMAAGGFKPRRVHAWRKRVIALREQLNVLQVKLPPRQRVLKDRLHTVARKLGGAQDLALLIAGEKASATGAVQATRLATLKQRRQRKIKAARRLARGLTSELQETFPVDP